MTTKLLRVGAPAALLILSLVRLAVGDPFAEPAGPTERASEEAIAVLDGLAVGDDVAGLEVVRISGPTDHQIVVGLTRGDAGVRIWIGRLASGPREAPASTTRFDLFYGPPPPASGLEPVTDAEAVAAVSALAERIENGGAEVPEAM